MAKRLSKRRCSTNNDWHDRAGEVLDAARAMAPGAARDNALKAAETLRNAAAMYALFFNPEVSVARPTVPAGMNTGKAESHPTTKD